MNHRFIKLVIMGALGLLLGCSSDHSSDYVYRGNLNRTGVLEYSETDLGYRSLSWVKDFELEISSEPLIVKDNLYFGGRGSVVSYDLESDTVNWLKTVSVENVSYIIATPVLYSDSLLIVCPNFETGRFKQQESSIIILSKSSGKQVKEIKLPFGFIKRPPVLNENILYVGLSYRDTKDVWNGIEMKDKGSVLAVDLESGEILWRKETADWVMTSLSLIDDHLIYGGYDSYLHCVDINTQRELWAFNVDGKIMATPAFQDTNIVVGTLEGRIFGLGLKSGKQLWRYSSGSKLKATPTIENNIVNAHFDEELIGLDLSNGNILYKIESDRDGMFGSPAVTDNTLFSFDENRIYAVNVLTGELLWQVDLDDLPRAYTKKLEDIGDLIINRAMLYIPLGSRLLEISLSPDNENYPVKGEWLIEDDDDQLIDPISGELYSGVVEEWYTEYELSEDSGIDKDLPYEQAMNDWYKQKFVRTNLKKQFSVEDGLITGTFKVWYPNGQLETEMEYAAGVPNGSSISYYETGQKYSECHYVPEDENTMVSISDYYPRQGNYTQWYENGQLREEAEFENGFRNGKYYYYFENGQLREEANYLRDQMVGAYKSYSSDGLLKSEKEYETFRIITLDKYSYYIMDDEGSEPSKTNFTKEEVLENTKKMRKKRDWYDRAESNYLNLEKQFSNESFKTQVDYYYAGLLYRQSNWDASIERYLAVYESNVSPTLSEKALFSIGDIYNNQLNDYTAVKKYYNLLLSEYPSTEFKESVEYELKYLGVPFEQTPAYKKIMGLK